MVLTRVLPSEGHVSIHEVTPIRGPQAQLQHDWHRFGRFLNAPSSSGTPELPAFVSTPAPQAPSEKPAPRRRVYVLHSGMNDRDNEGANTIRTHLLSLRDANGKPLVDEKDIVVLKNEYPHMELVEHERRDIENRWKGWPRWMAKVATAVQSVVNTIQNFFVYNRMRRPESSMAQASYRNFRQQLADAGVGPDDELIGMAHSGGGQVMLTLDHLASRDKRHNRQHFSSLVLFACPIGQNHAPAETRIVSYDSPADNIVNIATEEGLQRYIGLPPLGIAPTIRPPNRDSNDTHVVLPGVDHRAWFRDPRFTRDALQRLGLMPQPTPQPAGP